MISVYEKAAGPFKAFCIRNSGPIHIRGQFLSAENLWYSRHLMDAQIKQAVIIIAIGICIPLAALPFVTGFDGSKGITDNFYSVGIPITKGKPANPAAQGVSESGKPQDTSAPKAIPPVKIPFRFFLAVTVVFLFVAVIKIDRAKRRRKTPPEDPEPTEPI